MREPLRDIFSPLRPLVRLISFLKFQLFYRYVMPIVAWPLISPNLIENYRRRRRCLPKPQRVRTRAELLGA